MTAATDTLALRLEQAGEFEQLQSRLAPDQRTYRILLKELVNDTRVRLDEALQGALRSDQILHPERTHS